MMAKIIEYKDIPLKHLIIGKGQVRTRDVGKGIDDLATSIDKVGLLEPILVVPSAQEGRFELILGQRRFLAHRELGRKTITAGILDERVDEITAKVLSVTENLVREDLNQKDLIDVCTYLYKKYGTIKAVVEETGLRWDDVRKYVKYDRLVEPLKEMVDKGEVNMDVALRAQDAAEAAADASGVFESDDAIKLAKEMRSMSQAQRKKIQKDISNSPNPSVDEVIEQAKRGGKITQILVTLGASAHQSLHRYAADEGASIDSVAADLIEQGLRDKGYYSE
jgi:ParB family chromosome partitioning protein